VSENARKLQDRGYWVIGPAYGTLASGAIGTGRLADLHQLVAAIERMLTKKQAPTIDLTDRKIVITAGPTREFIDPVRFVSNPSTGKMGHALAEEAAAAGAEVTLITGTRQTTSGQLMSL